MLYASDPYQRVAVVDLAGRIHDMGMPHNVYGFDGTHVLGGARTCTYEGVVSVRVADDKAPFGDDPDPECPMRFSRARLVLGDPRARLLLRLSCPNGCLGPVAAGTKGYVDGASREFKVRPGQHRRVTIHLAPDSSLERRARGHQSVRVGLDTFSFSRFDPREPATSQAARGSPEQHVVARVVTRR
jgi:hypothetical protein